MKRPFLYIIMLIFAGGILGAGLTGCGESLFEGLADDSSRDAKIEKANMAIDNGNYNEAINLLKPLVAPLLDSDGDGTLDNDGDGEVTAADIDSNQDGNLDENDFTTPLTAEDADLLTKLASAYLGKAGVDTLQFLNAAANITAKATFKDQIQGVLVQLQQGLGNFWVTSAFAQAECEFDPNFQFVSDALDKVTDYADSMDDLELGIAILDALKNSGYLETNGAEENNIEFLQAVGYFTRLVLDILAVTDIATPLDHIPDLIQVSNLDATHAARIDEAFTKVSAAILGSGILGTLDDGETPVEDFNENDFSKVIQDLRADINTSDNTPNTWDDDPITETELETYLTNTLTAAGCS